MSAEKRASFREAVGPGLAGLARAIAADRDLGGRELEAAASFARLITDLDDTLVGEALDVVADAPEGVAVLSCLTVGGSTELAVRAHVRLEERGDVPTVALLTVTEAWRLTAEDSPVESISVLGEREGEKGAQLFSFMIDHEVSDGAVKLGFASGLREGKRLARELVRGDYEDATLTPLDPAVAHAAIVAAAVSGARGGWQPDEDGLLALRVYLRASRTPDADAIVQAIELGDSLPDRVEAFDLRAAAEAAGALVVGARTWFDTEGLDEPGREWGVKALELMLDYSLGVSVEVGAWREDELDDFLLAWVPENVTLEDEAASRFVGGVRDALRFLVVSDLIETTAAETLDRCVVLLRTEFEEAMREPPGRGPASALVAAMLAEGVEIGDQAAVQAWIEGFNARSWEERDAVLGPALAPVEDAVTGAGSGGRAGSAGTPSKKRAARKAQRRARRRNRG